MTPQGDPLAEMYLAQEQARTQRPQALNVLGNLLGMFSPTRQGQQGQREDFMRKMYELQVAQKMAEASASNQLQNQQSLDTSRSQLGFTPTGSQMRNYIDEQAEANKPLFDRNEAMRYGYDRSLEGDKYGADKRFEATKYASDAGLEGDLARVFAKSQGGMAMDDYATMKNKFVDNQMKAFTEMGDVSPEQAQAAMIMYGDMFDQMNQKFWPAGYQPYAPEQLQQSPAGAQAASSPAAEPEESRAFSQRMGESFAENLLAGGPMGRVAQSIVPIGQNIATGVASGMKQSPFFDQISSMPQGILEVLRNLKSSVAPQNQGMVIPR